MFEKDSLVPYVIEQSARGERSYDIFSRLLKDIIIFYLSFLIMSESSIITIICFYLINKFRKISPY